MSEQTTADTPVLSPDAIPPSSTPAPAKPPAAPPADPGPVGIDWSAELDPEHERTPQSFRKFKTLQDAAKSYAELERALTAKSEKIKELESGRGKGADPDPDPDPPPKSSRFNEALALYFRERKVPKPMLDELAEAHNMSPNLMVEMLDAAYTRREQFMARAKEAVPDADIPAIEAWIKSGSSPFSESDLSSLSRLAGKGYLGWLSDVQSAYEEFVRGGGSFVDPTTKQAYGSVPEVSARPAGAERRGFETFGEYVQANRKAMLSGDPEEVRKVQKKLAETPESVQQSKAWGRH